MRGMELTTDPDGAYMIWLPSGGSRSPASGQTLARGEHYIRMEGRETYRYATKTMATTALKAIAYKAEWITSSVASGLYTITGTVEAPGWWVLGRVAELISNLMPG